MWRQNSVEINIIITTLQIPVDSRVGDRMIQGKPQETNSEHETSLIIK